ncbi:MAG TPA: PAS domain-containing protein, partial [Methylomirabilota bacterium]|nr:PAS domain-containing protein [Methylomirabilota bacterium]
MTRCSTRACYYYYVINRRPTRLTPYIAAALAVAISLAVLRVLPVSERSQLFLLLPAVVLVAWYGGLGPALFATAFASAGQAIYFVPPYADDLLRTLLFLLVAVTIAVLAAGRRRAVEGVRIQREELAVTLSSIGDAVVVADRAGRVTFMNPAAERLTGWGSSEAVGRDLPSVFSILDEQTGAPIENPATRAIREDAAVTLPGFTLLRRRDGEERAIDDSAAPVRSAAGEIVGAVLV